MAEKRFIARRKLRRDNLKGIAQQRSAA